MTPAIIAAVVLLIIGLVAMIEDHLDVKQSRVYREYSVVGPILMVLAAALAGGALWVQALS